MSVVCAVPAATVWSAPDRVRAVDSAAVQADNDTWVAGMSAEERVDLQGRTETQLLLGEAVTVLGVEGDWSQVVVPGQSSSKSVDGYPGWVPSALLTDWSDDDAGETVVVRVPRAVTCSSAGTPSGALTIGTTLRLVDEADGRVRLAAPSPVWVSAQDVQRVGLPAVSTLSALSVAEQLLGMAYVWGGCGAGGIDCSGLVLTAHRVLGRPVPRDAHDQLAAIDLVPLEQRQRGDVLFFARPGRPAHHVGFDAGDGMLLHASMNGGHGTVECVPMPVKRAATLVAAGRFLPAP